MKVLVPGLLCVACACIVACGNGSHLGQTGDPCVGPGDCEQSFCLNLVCADPEADVDYDGVGSRNETMLFLDPFNPDSDGDGLPDGYEVGDDPAHPVDVDSDGLIDARESAVRDSDGDCLPDQYDPVAATAPATSVELVPVRCSGSGVCGDGREHISAVCVGGVVSCNYEMVPGWNSDEWICDARDNNCNGATDEGFYYDGIPVGLPCAGVGQCGAGLVECDASGFLTRCSSDPGGSMNAAVDEICDGLDNDCDGLSDDGLGWDGILLGGRCDGTGECGIGVVECLPDGTAGCSTLLGGSREQVVDEYCDGADNDCDGATDESFSGDPAAVCTPKGICSQHANKVGLACENGSLVCDYGQVPGYSGPHELLCDGVDDDCDGQVDEEPVFAVSQPGGGTRLPGQSCGVGACAGGTVECSVDGLSAVCNTAVFITGEVCNEADDDCDGIRDDGYLKKWTSPPLTVADVEPQSRVSSMLAVVEYSVEETPGPDEPPAGVYVCGGARSGTSAAPYGISGDCWRYDIPSRRFLRIPGGPVLEAGALVHDRAGGRLLMVGNIFVTGEPGVWALGNVEQGWQKQDLSLTSGTVMAAGIEPATRELQVLLKTSSGVFVLSVDLDDAVAGGAEALMSVRPGTIAAFDPAGGFFIIHACDELADTVFEHVSAQGVVQSFQVAGGAPCMSYGAAVMPQPDRMIVMEGIDSDGLINGTSEFMLVDGVWHRGVITQPRSFGAVVLPGLAAFGDDVYAFSGMHADGRGLRRMARLEPGMGEWSVVSVVRGPSPRASGVAFVSLASASAYFVGGYGDEPGGPVPLADVWRFDLVNHAASQVMTTGDAGVIVESAAAIDQDTQVAYIFGGLDGASAASSRPTARLVRFNCETGRFENMAPGTLTPPPRYGHSMVWTGDRLIVYGGLNDDGFLGDIWTWMPSGGWTYQGDFGLRFGHDAFWDARRERMLVAGGRPGSDLRAWNPADGQWEILSSNTLFDSYQGQAWFDEESDSLLYVPGSAPDAVVVEFDGGNVVESVLDGLQQDILASFGVYDPFGRRALLLGGLDPETGTTALGRQISQTCPR